MNRLDHRFLSVNDLDSSAGSIRRVCSVIPIRFQRGNISGVDLLPMSEVSELCEFNAANRNAGQPRFNVNYLNVQWYNTFIGVTLDVMTC
jgi:hypothetical protein